jgi:hypothetical protein
MNEDLLKFIREQPYWYRKLSRGPLEVESFELAMMQHYKKTIPDRVNKLQSQVQLATFLVDIFRGMKS